jgi:hypothetical protein
MQQRVASAGDASAGKRVPSRSAARHAKPRGSNPASLQQIARPERQRPPREQRHRVVSKPRRDFAAHHVDGPRVQVFCPHRVIPPPRSTNGCLVPARESARFILRVDSRRCTSVTRSAKRASMKPDITPDARPHKPHTLRVTSRHFTSRHFTLRHVTDGSTFVENALATRCDRRHRSACTRTSRSFCCRCVDTLLLPTNGTGAVG